MYNSHMISADEGNVDLAKPEFEGLWDKHKPYKVPKEEGGIKLPGATKMEKVKELFMTVTFVEVLYFLNKAIANNSIDTSVDLSLITIN